MRRGLPLFLKSQIEQGLKFSCTACGRCCKGRTNVFVNYAELSEISRFKGLDVDQFAENYIQERLVNGVVHQSLKPAPNSKQCVFLENNKCSIYEVRPTQCRTYPFWPEIMVGEAEWKGEAHYCEGISPSLSTETPSVNKEVVYTNMIIHQIHNRGAGEDWTYEESKERLQEVCQEDPSTISTFADDFHSTHSSSLLFEGRVCRVVQTALPRALPRHKASNPQSSTPLESNLSTLSVDSSEEDGQGGEGEEEEEMEIVLSRRLEFLSSPNTTQSEVFLSSLRGSSASFDLSLPSLPLAVHREMTLLALQLMSTPSIKSPSAPRVCVVGGGGCVLPLSLLHNHSLLPSSSSSPSRLALEVVEREQEVVDCARQYFGADQWEGVEGGGDGSGLSVRCVDSQSFFRGRAEEIKGKGKGEGEEQGEREGGEGGFDLIIVDVFGKEDIDSPSSSHSSSPSSLSSSSPPSPQALAVLSPDPLRDMFRTLHSEGTIMINCYNSSSSSSSSPSLLMSILSSLRSLQSSRMLDPSCLAPIPSRPIHRIYVKPVHASLPLSCPDLSSQPLPAPSTLFSPANQWICLDPEEELDIKGKKEQDSMFENFLENCKEEEGEISNFIIVVTRQ